MSMIHFSLQYHYDFHYLQDSKPPAEEKDAKHVKRGASSSENEHLEALSVRIHSNNLSLLLVTQTCPYKTILFLKPVCQ